MTDENNKKKENDSLGIPIEKSPWAVFAALQIPIVVIMILAVYFLYQARSNS